MSRLIDRTQGIKGNTLDRTALPASKALIESRPRRLRRLMSLALPVMYRKRPNPLSTRRVSGS